MPRPKKSSSKSGAPRVNKSEWIRSQPATLPAKEVLSRAKKEGIKLSIAQIYTARSAAKKKAEGGKVGRAKAQTAARGASTSFASREIESLRHEYVRIAMRIGTDEAQRLLDRIIDVQTPSGR